MINIVNPEISEIPTYPQTQSLDPQHIYFLIGLHDYLFAKLLQRRLRARRADP